VDLIVHAAYCVYDLVATAAHEVQRRYDIKGAKAFYLSAACSSFVNGLEAIEGYFAMGKASKALLICPEHNTYYADESDPKSGHLWGDGAVAFFISKEKVADSDRKILGIFTEGLGQIGAGPEGVKLMPAEGGISMPNGRDVFMNACKYMEYALDKVLTDASLSVDDLSHVICHQANMRIISYVAKELGKEEGVCRTRPLPENKGDSQRKKGRAGGIRRRLQLRQRSGRDLKVFVLECGDFEFFGYICICKSSEERIST